MGERTDFSINNPRKTGPYKKKNQTNRKTKNIESLPHSIITIDSNWLKDFRWKSKIIKLLKGNKGEYPHNLGVGKYFLNKIST